MNALLKGLEARGEVPANDTDIGSQLLRVMREHPGISRDRVLSEIGILFVEGFETTGKALSLVTTGTSPPLTVTVDTCYI